LWIFSIFSVDELIEYLFDLKLDLNQILYYLKRFWCGETKDPLWTLYLHDKEMKILFKDNRINYEQIKECEKSFENVTFDENVTYLLLCLLLKEGLNINATIKGGKDGSGKTLLHVFASKGDEDAFNLLLSHNAKIDSRDEQGQTPLHLATEHKYMNIVASLLKSRCSIVRDKTLKTPVDLAIRNNHETMVKLLYSTGFDSMPNL